MGTPPERIINGCQAGRDRVVGVVPIGGLWGAVGMGLGDNFAEDVRVNRCIALGSVTLVALGTDV